MPIEGRSPEHHRSRAFESESRIPEIRSGEKPHVQDDRKNAELAKVRHELHVPSPPHVPQDDNERIDPTGNIRVAYDGILSGKMRWNGKVLDTISDAADLRTQVVIKRGHELPERQVTSLGNVLAWKTFANPFEAFAKSQKRGQDYEVKIQSETVHAEVILHDQRMQNNVGENHEGKFDEKAFTRRTQDIVEEGLGRIVAWEKGYQIRESIKQAVIVGGGLTIHAGLIIGGSAETIINLPAFLASAIGVIPPDPSLLLKVPLGFVVGAGSAVFLENRIENLGRYGIPSLIKPNLSKYIASGKDIDPFKHISDWMKSRRIIRKLKSEIVTLPPTH